MQVSSGLGGGDCGYPFHLGESYLVYAFTNPETKELSTSICTLTKLLADAKKDVEYIETLKTEPAGTRLYGQVPDYTRSKSGTRVSPKSLSGADIRLKGPQGVQHLSSDKYGKYEWKGLPAGKYQIGVTLPNYVSLSPQDSEFELRGRGCFMLDLPVESNGQIEGRVSDDQGNPVAHQRVELADPEGNGLGELRTETDEEGRYRFSGVRPGDFLIGVNLSDPPDSKSRFVRTYFPGTLTRENAAIVHLSKAGKLTGYDIYLSRRTESRTVQGVVLWPDGKPASNATISLGYPDYLWRSDAQPGPDAQGNFSIHVLTNVRTILWVQAQNGNGVWMNAGQLELPTEGEVKKQVLYLDHEPPKWTPR